MLGAQLLQLRHHTVGDVRDALGVEGVHHVLDNVHLVLDGEVDEVGVDQNVERRPKLGVVLEEEGTGALDMLSCLELIRILRLTSLGNMAYYLDHHKHYDQRIAKFKK